MSTNAIAFVRDDVVELEVWVGNGVSSVARYRLNPASDADPWTDLVLGSVSDPPGSPSSVIVFFSNMSSSITIFGDAGHLPCRAHRVRMFG